MIIRKDRFGFYSVNYKFPCQKKEQEWVLSKIDEGSFPTISMQSDNRYAYVNLTTGKVLLSDKHNNPNLWLLQNDLKINKAKIFILPENDLNDIKNSEMMKNVSESIISIFSNNS